MRFVRREEVVHKLGFSKNTLYRLISAGKFPEPRPITPSGWIVGRFESEIDEWINCQAHSNPETSKAQIAAKAVTPATG
jgi:predicted DNA-binding transcriptional regulator AlpA